MSIKTRRFGPSPMLPVLVTFLFLAVTATGSDPTRKLDETAAPGEVKCGSCVTPVVSPPPPPSSPPPPSPELCPPPPYVKPPSSPKNPPSGDNGGTPSSPKSPPSAPSPPSYMYITGPPGDDLYPIDNSTSGTTGRTDLAGSVFPVLAGCAVLGLFVAV